MYCVPMSLLSCGFGKETAYGVMILVMGVFFFKEKEGIGNFGCFVGLGVGKRRNLKALTMVHWRTKKVTAQQLPLKI